MSEPLQDPQWARFAAQPETGIVQTPHVSPPTLAVGAMVCDGCDQPHVLVAAIYADVETDVFLTPAAARDFAIAVLAAADRVDPQVKQ